MAAGAIDSVLARIRRIVLPNDSDDLQSLNGEGPTLNDDLRTLSREGWTQNGDGPTFNDEGFNPLSTSTSGSNANSVSIAFGAVPTRATTKLSYVLFLGLFGPGSLVIVIGPIAGQFTFWPPLPGSTTVTRFPPAIASLFTKQ